LLQGLGGQNIRVSFEQPDTLFHFNVNLDDVSLLVSSALDVTVRTVAPELEPLTLSATSINENGEVTLTGTFTDPGTLDTHEVVIRWGDGSPDTVLRLTGGERNFITKHHYLDDNPTGTPADTYTIGVTVTDDDKGAHSGSVDVTVNNVSPVITSFSNSAATIGLVAEAGTVTVSASFTDAGTLDTHQAVINWGDGTIETVTVGQGSGSGTVSASHVYTSGGAFTISLNVTDDDTGAALATTGAYVTGVGVHDGVLHIIGTAGADQVNVSQDDNGRYVVAAGFLPGGQRTVDNSGVQSILAFLGAGDDHFTIARSILTPLVVDGGEGNDQLHGAGGPSILIGGLGSDRLLGGPGENILIAGWTAFDGDHIALGKILAEWSSGRSLEERARNLIDGSGSEERANDSYFLTAGADGTVHEDADRDALVGGPSEDWYFANLSDDKANDLRDELFANDLESWLHG